MNILKVISIFFLTVKSSLSKIFTVIRFSNIVTSYGVTIGKGNTFGNFVKIYPNSSVAYSKIGDYTYIGGNCKLQNCNIGKFCSIAPEVIIGMGIHPINHISTYPGFYSSKASGVKSFYVDSEILEHKIVTIGNDVWIGTRALVLDGVSIGDGVVIAAGSIVTKDIPSYAVVGGIPAKVIKYRFNQENIDCLMRYKWWDKNEEELRREAKFFTDSKKFFEKIGFK